jgi:hypothetical protein
VTPSGNDPLIKLSPQELCEQPAAGDEYWGNPEKETAAYFDRAQRVMNWIARYPRAAAKLCMATVRCPARRGCLLAEVYGFDLSPRLDPLTGEVSRPGRLLAVTRLRSGRTAGGFCNWAFSDGWAGPAHWFPASCQHGSAKLDRHWLIECVGAIHIWKHKLETEKQFLEKLPYEQAVGRRRAVFHPPIRMWIQR